MTTLSILLLITYPILGIISFLLSGFWNPERLELLNQNFPSVILGSIFWPITIIFYFFFILNKIRIYINDWLYGAGSFEPDVISVSNYREMNCQSCGHSIKKSQ